MSDATEDRTVPESDEWGTSEFEWDERAATVSAAAPTAEEKHAAASEFGPTEGEQAVIASATTEHAATEHAATEHAATEHAATEPVSPEAAASIPVAPPFTQQERVGRGLALALLVIPAGIIVWTIVWNLGFVASIVSWGVAAGAVFLYRLGSKARVTPAGYWGLIVIVAVTVVLSFLAGIFTDIVKVVGIPLGEALTRADFWQLYADNIFGNRDMWSAYTTQILMTVAFAALGCFTTFRRLSREARA